MKVDLISMKQGTLLENFYPEGWDLQRLYDCCQHTWEELTERQAFWNGDFEVIPVNGPEDYAVMQGFEMAKRIKDAYHAGREIGLILPVGPIDQYEWCAFFLNSWDISCDHVYGFNMDDWSDADGNIANVFGPKMEKLFYNKLNKTVPEDHRFFATKEVLPKYGEMMDRIHANGGEIVTVYGVGRPLRLAFSEPHFAADHESEASWLKEEYRIAGALHPLSIEENSFITYRGNFTAIPCYANTVTMGLMLKSDYMIGGCCAEYYPVDVNWQGICAWATLRYGPDMWVPCSYVPTRPGKFYVSRQLANTKGPYLPSV